jgi:putative membrane protein
MDEQPGGIQGGAARAEAPADARFLLANERTFLAYVRTALALQVAGLGALQFLTRGHVVVRVGLGLVLVATGSAVAMWARRERAQNEHAIRTGTDVSHSPAGSVVVGVVTVVPLVAAVLLALH